MRKTVTTITLATAALLFFFVVFFNLPEVRALWLRRYDQLYAPQEFDSRFDPRLETSVPLPNVDAYGKRVKLPSGNTLVIACGSCSSCAIKALNPFKVKPGPYQAVLLVYAAQAKSIPASLKSLKAPFRVLADPDRHLSRFLNAVWTPRFYEIDSLGRLKRCQQGVTDPWATQFYTEAAS